MNGSPPDWSRFGIRNRDSIIAVVLWLCAMFVVGVLGWILCDIFWRGLSSMSWSYLTKEVVDSGRQGGIGPVITSTLLILLVTLVVAVPLSLASAVALAWQSRKQAMWADGVRRFLDILAGVPSIVFGLFGNAFFCITLGLGYSILAGGLTLACMVLPILTRTAEQAIRDVPNHYLYGAAALGLSNSTTLFHIVLPAATPALAAGLVLGIGRALAETAALLFTAGYVTRQPESLFDSGRALSVHIYDLTMNVEGGNERAYAAAVVLIGMLLVINVVSVAATRFADKKIRGMK